MSDATAVQPYMFKTHEIRSILLDGEPWFVARDVCVALGISDTGQAVSRLDQGDQCQAPVATKDGNRSMWLVNEPGLYELVIRSDKPSAREFRRWITSEVLPQIRKTGAYAATPPAAVDPLDAVQVMLDQLRQQRNQLATHDRALAELGARVDRIDVQYERYAATGYANMNNLRGDVAYLNRLGRAAASIGRRQGIPFDKTHSTIFGEVNTWPVEVWDEAYRIVGP